MAFSWLINGGYSLLTNWDDPPSNHPRTSVLRFRSMESASRRSQWPPASPSTTPKKSASCWKTRRRRGCLFFSMILWWSRKKKYGKIIGCFHDGYNVFFFNWVGFHPLYGCWTKNRGTPKWKIFFFHVWVLNPPKLGGKQNGCFFHGTHYFKMDGLGENPLFLETSMLNAMRSWRTCFLTVPQKESFRTSTFQGCEK